MDFIFIAKVFALMLVLDMAWITLFFKPRFAAMIQNVQGSPMNVRLPGAVVAYIAMLLLALLFLPLIETAQEAFVLGFLVYAVYDGTNYATLANWDARLAVMDSLWGGVLFAILHVALF